MEINITVTDGNTDKDKDKDTDKYQDNERDKERDKEIKENDKDRDRDRDNTKYKKIKDKDNDTKKEKISLRTVMQFLKIKQYSYAINALQIIIDQDITLVNEPATQSTIIDTEKNEDVLTVVKPRKLRTVYNIYMSDTMKRIKDDTPNMNSAERMAETVRLWKAMTSDDKSMFEKQVANRR